jgi:hypothetical protein
MKIEQLQQEIKSIKKEILALKTPQGMINNVESYFATISNPTSKVRITYEDGKNDIITFVYYIGDNEPDFILTKPKNNQQLILTFTEYQGADGYFIVSTRPIKSVIGI